MLSHSDAETNSWLFTEMHVSKTWSHKIVLAAENSRSFEQEKKNVSIGLYRAVESSET